MTGEERRQRVLGQLDGVKASGGNQHRARCPLPSHGRGHGDKNPSLSISLGDDGETVVMSCHADCDLDDILAARGLTAEDLRPERVPTPAGTWERRHPYHDREGRVTAVKVRRKSARGRSWAWVRPDGTKGLGGVKPGLYRRPQIDAALRIEQNIWIAEGERDADTLAGLGLAATTAPYGAGPGKKWHDEWTEVLRGAIVVVVADRDQVGISFAREVAAKLSGAGCRVSMLVPPVAFKDITDMIDAGLSTDDLMPLTADLDLSTPKVTRRYLDDGRPAFIMLPHYWWSELDPHCCQMVWALADQYSARFNGRNKLAKLLGWGRNTIDRHLGHLEAAGIVEKKPGDGHQDTVRLRNPSRQWTPSGPPADSQRSTVEMDTGLPAVHPSNSRGPNFILGSGEVEGEVEGDGEVEAAGAVAAFGAEIETTGVDAAKGNT